MNNNVVNLKRMAGERAADFVEDGMTIGLGTGSTVYWTVMKLGILVRQGLRIRAIPTSRQTEELALQEGVPVVGFGSVQALDVAIDGADEISPTLDLIKGRGGALLREKLVAEASEKFVIVADHSKLVPELGSAPLPVEVVSFGWETTQSRIGNLGLPSTLRLSNKKPFLTDNGNYILDCISGKIENPARLDESLKSLTGVVETGLFTGLARIAVIAGPNGTSILKKSGKT